MLRCSIVTLSAACTPAKAALRHDVRVLTVSCAVSVVFVVSCRCCPCLSSSSSSASLRPPHSGTEPTAASASSSSSAAARLRAEAVRLTALLSQHRNLICKVCGNLGIMCHSARYRMHATWQRKDTAEFLLRPNHHRVCLPVTAPVSHAWPARRLQLLSGFGRPCQDCLFPQLREQSPPLPHPLAPPLVLLRHLAALVS